LIGEFFGLEAGPGGGADHGGVVSGQGQGREGYADVAAGGFSGEAGAEFAVGCHSAGDEDAADAEGFGGGEGLLHEVADDRVLEAGDEVEGGLGTEGEGFCFGGGGSGGCGRNSRSFDSPPQRRRPVAGDPGSLRSLRMTVICREEAGGAGVGLFAEVVELDVAEDGGLDAGEGEEEMGVEVGDGGGEGGLGAGRAAGEMELGLDLRKGEGDGEGVAVAGEGVNPGASGITEAEELGDLVVGFAGSVVDGAADEGVGPCAVGGTGEKEVGVAAGDDQGEGGLFRWD